ncbi:dihydrofolate reductase family protein [Litoribacillus peritrichatus]|uniref:Dihydrofolate reductase family protein n=1 Tax=Litoribacillus peritrichatus TaxID=718191 RepID=A0ABP7M5T2_9GAMM
MSNIIYIATSLDGYITDKNGSLDWLFATPNPDNDDFGFNDFMNRIDALVMGKNTFETVCAMDCEWPYSKPVFVLSNSLDEIPEEYKDKAQLMGYSPLKGAMSHVVSGLNKHGFENLYIDGGLTIQGFLKEDLIDEMILTRVPVILGGGTPLFSKLNEAQAFEHLETKVLLNALVKSRYVRKR